jgi:hypothetical protein
MGTHPTAPSTLPDHGNIQLLALLRDHPELLGAAAQEFGVDLPFLFKVLSVETALSIQSHPDKALAEALHAERPQVRRGGARWGVGRSEYERKMQINEEGRALPLPSLPCCSQSEGGQLLGLHEPGEGYPLWM